MAPTLISVAGLLIFAGLLIWAAACDLTSMEIPNRISILAAGLYPIFAFACGLSWNDTAVHVATGAATLLVCYILFAIGIFGGGDAKLLAAAAVWTGPEQFLPFALCTALAGGVLTASLIGARAAMRPAEGRPDYVNRLLRPDCGVPYAIAIALGGLTELWNLPLWQHATLAAAA